MILACAVLGLAVLVAAQDYPTKNITLIVPFAAGGPTDVISRIIGEHMSRTLGDQLDHRERGAARAGPPPPPAPSRVLDGYTLITGHMGTHAASVALYPKSGCNTTRAPISSRSVRLPARRSWCSPKRTCRRRT